MVPEANNTSSVNATFRLEDRDKFSHPFFHETTSGKVIIAFLVLQASLIFAANTLVFVLFKQKKCLRTTTNYCLISLAASDLLAGALSLPLVLACSCTGSWPLCLSMDLCQRFLSISTILHLLIATGERYFKILHPFKYQTLVTRARVTGTLVGAWLFSCCASLVQLLWTDLTGSTQTPHKDFVYSVTCLAVLVAGPFAVIVGVDVKIFNFIRKGRRIRRVLTGDSVPNGQRIKQKRKQKTERKTVLTYVFMTVSFALGWFPYFIITLLIDLRLVDGRSIPLAVSFVFVFMKFNTALVNPLLYTFLKADFRKAFRKFTEYPTSTQGKNYRVSLKEETAARYLTVPRQRRRSRKTNIGRTLST